jgi:Cytochrome oxidase complex assembly protein 1
MTVARSRDARENVNQASGEANLAILISGAKGKGTLYVAATKSAASWNYPSIVLKLKQAKKRIDVFHESE